MAMKLYYFDAPGRAEVARIMLKSSGTEFTDVRFSREEWGQTYKKMSPTGQCPWLELPDGTLIAQTAAIEAYLMKKTGYCPADDVAEAKVWMMCACIGDLWQAIIPTFAIQDKEELLTARKALVAEGGGVKVMLDAMEKMLSNASTEFCASDKPSVADLNIYKTISDLKSGSFDGIAPEYFANYPHLVRIRDAVAKLPAMAAIYKDDPKKAHYT